MSCSHNQEAVDANFLPHAAERSSVASRFTDVSAGNLSQHSTTLNWVSRAFKLAEVWYERARGRRALLRLNDHLLKDIGISRLDADIESTKSFWQQ